MKRFGIIGYPLSHSFSPGYFTQKFKAAGLANYRYDAFPLSSIDDLKPLLLAYPNLLGLNVTIPYKSVVIPLLDEISDAAKAIGAVNVIKIEEGRLIGHNSDVYGFEVSLRNFLPSPIPVGLSALVLGTGGAAKAVQYVLKKMAIPYKMVSRTKKGEVIDYQAVNEAILAKHHLIVNTTPLGMSPMLETFPPIPYEHLTTSHYLYDLVYNPEKTKFLELGEANGSEIQNGLSMLYLQAEKAWEIWNT
ncbi:MAG: shikimate dehydrogenase [Saprospiraceae bacterium]|nr:shikimate dehydrogenase [Saprospiraceae bacterium]